MSPKVRRIVIGVLGLVVAGGFAFAFLNGDPGSSAKDGEVEVEGTVERIAPIVSTKDPNLAEIVVVFTDPETGKEYRAQGEVSFPDDGPITNSTYLKEGDVRSVAYDPADPGDARVLNEKSPPIVYLALAGVALAVAIASLAGVDFVGLASKLPIRHTKTS